MARPPTRTRGTIHEELHPLSKVTLGEKLFNTTGQSLNMASFMLMFPMMLLGGVSGFFSKRMSPDSGLGTTLGKVSKFSGIPNTNLADVPGVLEETLGMGARKHAESIGNFANRMLGHNMASRLSKVPMLSAVQLGISGFSLASTGRTFADKIRVLKHLYHDVTGRNISTVSLLMGHNLPPIVKRARGQSLGLRTGLAAFMDVGLTAFNVWSMLYPDKQPKFMQSGFLSNPFVQVLGMGALYQIPSMLIGSGPDPLTVYKESHRFAARGPLPEEGYAMLVRNLAPGNMSDDEVAARAHQCFTEHWTPKEVAVGMSQTYGRGGYRPVIGPATARLQAEGYRQYQQGQY